jgi:hypothetical protein
MARRAGVLHGFLVFLGGVLVLVAVAAVTHAQDGTDAILDRLDSLGIPTSGDEWAEIGSVAGIAALVAIIVGSLLGGMRGERWHQRLSARALDPEVGPTVATALAERYDQHPERHAFLGGLRDRFRHRRAGTSETVSLERERQEARSGRA